MNEFENYLLEGKRSAKLSAESLEMMGKQAANQFLGEDVSLNDAIAKLAGEHADITAEQIKRIAEFANTAVYLARHDQNKTAGADHSYPQFELADAGRIIQDLSDGARPTIVTQTDIDYNRLSNKQKISSARTEEAFVEMFKTASAPEPDSSPETEASNLVDTKNTLTSLRDNFTDRFNQFESLFKEATAEFYDLVKDHVLSGESLGDVYVALSNIDDTNLKQNFEPIVQKLLKEKVASPKVLKEQMSTQTLEKAAHRTTDTSHPIVKSYSAMLLAGQELQKTAFALDEIQTELDSISGFIKSAYTKKAGMMGIGKAALGAGKSLLGAVGKGAMSELKSNPVGTLGTAKSLMPSKGPAPVPPSSINPGGV